MVVPPFDPADQVTAGVGPGGPAAPVGADGVDIQDLETRTYPDETIFVVYVAPRDFRAAVQLGNGLDSVFSSQGFTGFVSVREGQPPKSKTSDLMDARVEEMMNLLVARSRASEMHPSLSYVPDIAGNISAVQSQRHHLVFGRRGAGKTALLVEGKRLIEAAGHSATWLNLQVYRWEEPASVFAQIAKEIAEAMLRVLASEPATEVAAGAEMLRGKADHVLASEAPPLDDARKLLPEANRALRRFCLDSDRRLYVFLDDFHYVRRNAQPQILDLAHGMTRDTDVWLKVAAIRNLTRWYSPTEHLGLQTVHDADTIDLDITLSDPARAKAFLETVLQRFADQAGLRSLLGVFHKRALDRLVLASGGVPRELPDVGCSSY